MSEQIPLIPQIPRALRDAAARGVLVPFVGAGASVLTGCPTWHSFADGALKECINANKFTHGQLDQIGHLPPRIKLSIARGLEAEHKIKLDYGRLINPRDGYEKNEKGARVYRSLGKLANTFVTTNYDSWLDIELPEGQLSITEPVEHDKATAPIKRESIFDVTRFTIENLNQPNKVFHLHGSLADPSGMVITTRDYLTRYANDRSGSDGANENRTLTFLSHLFREKTVLFVGYGLDDLEILEYVIQKARSQSANVQPQARHFMLQGYFSHEYELMRSMTLYYAQCDIQLLPFRRDQKDWEQLIDVLESFAVEMPARPPLSLQMHLEMEALLADT